MSSLFNLARSICMPRSVPQLLQMSQRAMETKYSFRCPKYKNPPRSVAHVQPMDACSLNQQECEFKSMWQGKRHPCLDADKQTDCSLQRMWDDKCCIDPCEYAYPRFDTLYYKESDKCRRKYQRTWAECPMIKIVLKEICCFDEVDHPDPETRCLKRCPHTGCKMLDCLCQYGMSKRCPRTTMPCCMKSRIPPKCHRDKVRRKCEKVCTQYPSYSECQKCKPRPLRPVECKCKEVPPCATARLIKWD